MDDHDHERNNCRKEVEDFFDEMDRDFDGRLSFAEFMGEETPLEKLFKSMDKDGDGTVTKEVTTTTYSRWILEFQTMSEFLLRIFPPSVKALPENLCSHEIPGVCQHLQESDQRAGVKNLFSKIVLNFMDKSD